MIHLQDLSDVRTGRPTASPTTSTLATELRLLLLDIPIGDLALGETRLTCETRGQERKLTFPNYPQACGCQAGWLDADGRCRCEEHDEIVANVHDLNHLAFRHVMVE